MCTLDASECDSFETEETEYTEETNESTADTTGSGDGAKLFCKKCGHGEARVYLRSTGGHGYCKTCFLAITTHKFRATLGKSKLMRPNDSILIAYSGKANSTVLLHLVASASSTIATTARPLSNGLGSRCKVLYVDDGVVKGLAPEERERVRNALAEQAKSLPFATYVAGLSRRASLVTWQEIGSGNAWQASESEIAEDVALAKTFDNLKNDTARDESLKQLRRNALVAVARKLKCNQIFTADTSIDLAIKVLGDTSTGRGSHIPFNVALSDTRHADVTLVRPLKDFTGDDVLGYLHCCELRPIFPSSSYSSFPASIRNVATSFVRKLDSEFYGTVSAIYRTSEKLARKTNSKQRDDANVGTSREHICCIVCELTLDSCYPEKGEVSAVEAKLFSDWISTIGNGSLDSTIDWLNAPEQCSNDSDSASLSSRSILRKYLCYSCKLILLDSTKPHEILSNFLLHQNLQKQSSLASLRNRIVDFLL